MKKVFYIWLLIFVFWTAYRFLFVLPEWIDELIFKPIIFLGPVFYLVKKEKKKWASVGIKTGNLFVDIYLGIFLGLLFALEGLVTNYVKYGQFSFAPLVRLQGAGLLIYVFLSLMTAISEEILGRGFFFTRIFNENNNFLKAVFYSSLLFMGLHLPIALKNLSSWTLIIYLFSVFVLGAVNSLIFDLRKSLTLPILIHAFWNMTVALYL